MQLHKSAEDIHAPCCAFTVVHLSKSEILIYHRYLGETGQSALLLSLFIPLIFFFLRFILSLSHLSVCLHSHMLITMGMEDRGRRRSVLWKRGRTNADASPAFITSSISPSAARFSFCLMSSSGPLHYFQLPRCRVWRRHSVSFHSTLLCVGRLHLAPDKDRCRSAVNEIHPRQAVTHSVFTLGDDTMSSASIIHTHTQMSTHINTSVHFFV